MATWIVLGLIVLIGLYLVYIYNDLVRKRQMVREGWSGIDVQLKRRSDLIPNLVEAVKGYATHERAAFEAVTEMRTRAAGIDPADVAGRARAEGMLTQALGKLFAVAEAYPELKASANFRELQSSLESVEDALQLARRYYNGAVRALNVVVESFPSNLVARRFGFTQEEYFEIEDPAERAVPRVSF
ncbi:LemA family protein [Stappia indica]|uniref:LemA protein n=1 Tax=Stappia indica TaxID=538381 RepID=A0A285SNS4_9HYPH|nr:LemA family protein [Stappia indica]MCC4244044.1 LemA family protein [Stappia indica]SOC09780.1 LemA protein [Stappia indica]